MDCLSLVLFESLQLVGGVRWAVGEKPQTGGQPSVSALPFYYLQTDKAWAAVARAGRCSPWWGCSPQGGGWGSGLQTEQMSPGIYNGRIIAGGGSATCLSSRVTAPETAPSLHPSPGVLLGQRTFNHVCFVHSLEPVPCASHVLYLHPSHHMNRLVWHMPVHYQSISVWPLNYTMPCWTKTSCGT